MYKVVGSDGREYGPVDATLVRTWIAEGRLTADTLAQAEGSAEWRRLADFPEFADHFVAAGPDAAPVVPPLPPSDTPGVVLAEHVIGREPGVDIGACLSRAFELVKARPDITIGGTALVVIICTALAFIPFVGYVAGLVVNGPLFAGLYLTYLKLIRREPVSLGEVFSGFGPRFLPLMLASIVMGLLVAVGLLACLIPGIYLAVAWMFTLPLVIDRGLDFWPAMEASRRVANKVWLPLFGLQLIGALLAFAGALACVVGLFVTVPVAVGSMAYAYEDLFGRQGE